MPRPEARGLAPLRQPLNLIRYITRTSDAAPQPTSDAAPSPVTDFVESLASQLPAFDIRQYLAPSPALSRAAAALGAGAPTSVDAYVSAAAEQLFLAMGLTPDAWIQAIPAWAPVGYSGPVTLALRPALLPESRPVEDWVEKNGCGTPALRLLLQATLSDNVFTLALPPCLHGWCKRRGEARRGQSLEGWVIPLFSRCDGEKTCFPHALPISQEGVPCARESSRTAIPRGHEAGANALQDEVQSKITTRCTREDRILKSYFA